MNNSGTFTKLRPQSLLRQLFNCSETICLQAFSNSVSWSIYLEQGKIIYATHSVEPFDRLERHLRRLSHQIPLLTSEVRVQLRLMFEPDTYSQVAEHDSNARNQPPEYQAIQWLISQQYLHSTQTAVLIPELVKEVIESFLLLKEGTYELTETLNRMPIICRLDVKNILEHSQARLRNWKSFEPQISSPYQRPYLLISGKLQNGNLPNLKPNLTNWMKGFSLRHLAVIMNQDEIELAHNLYPHIIQGKIILHEPDPPFDQLPNTLEEFTQSSKLITDLINRKSVDVVEELSNTTSKAYPDNLENSITPIERSPKFSESLKENFQELETNNNINIASEKVTSNTVIAKKTYKIISVDDSPTILKEISRFLENENFDVVTINEPLKAVMSIIRHKPDLILLDLNMVGIDGYELCQIIRNNSLFKEIPIIFVTGNKGIVDKVKARLVGASGYLTKPFTRAELLKIVFMHLT
ncbi:response regulator [aff. Roholtiella sp. LEGE 12411]|uniref:response regulator n=1 Tax=aff. Roholtiella sp. LEGE 12411 TaxID=1828822 RepID=UPI0018804147|nr:response regulator [aff. Roholtiella sp. LEGE 12411]MBE9035995.1 response regulator [aff. Roholtiella sp. LEGE 12411]